MSSTARSTSDESELSETPLSPDTTDQLNGDVAQQEQDAEACHICKETYKSPRFLKCLHSFCEACIPSLIQKDSPDKELIECPLCHEFSRIPNGRVQNMQADLQRTVVSGNDLSKPVEANCCDCSGTLAVAICPHCAADQQHLCQSGVTNHKKMKAFSTHKPKFIGGDGDSSSTDSVIRFCETHTTEMLTLFCADCVIPICSDCMHKSHRTLLIDECHDFMKKTILDKVSNGRKFVDVCKQESVHFEESLEAVRENKDKIHNDIIEVFVNLTATLDNLKKKYLDSCASKFASIEDSIFESIQKCEDIACKLTRTCDTADSMLESASPVEGLSLVKPINTRITDLQSQLPLSSNNEAASHSEKVHFVPKIVDYEKALLSIIGPPVFQQSKSSSSLNGIAAINQVGDFFPTTTTSLNPSFDALNLRDTTKAETVLPRQQLFETDPFDHTAKMNGAIGGHIGAIGSHLPSITRADNNGIGGSHFSTTAFNLGVDRMGMKSPPRALPSVSSFPNMSSVTSTLGHNLLRNIPNPGCIENFENLPAPSFGKAPDMPVVGGDGGYNLVEALRQLSIPNDVSPPSTTGWTPGSLFNGGGPPSSTFPFNGPPGQLFDDFSAAGGPQLGPPGLRANGAVTPVESNHSGGTNNNGGVTLVPARKNTSAMQVKSKFGQLGPGKGQFSSPHGFCLTDSEEIVVADTNNHRIQVFDPDGDFKFQFGVAGREEGQLWYPRKVAFLPNSQQIVVCDRGSERSRMQMFAYDGTFIAKIAIRYIDIVAGLAVNSKGHIVAVDSVSPTVFVISEQGDLVNWFDCSEHMREPSDIAVSGDEVFVCDFKGHCVVVFNENGQYLRRIGSEGITNYPNGIDVSSGGDVLVGDSHGNRFHVAVFHRDGSTMAEFECPYVKVSRCCGLKITSEGFVVTLAKNNHHVLVLNTLYIHQR